MLRAGTAGGIEHYPELIQICGCVRKLKTEEYFSKTALRAHLIGEESTRQQKKMAKTNIYLTALKKNL